MKEKIKIPEWLIKKAATKSVSDWMNRWSKETLKKAGIPYKTKLILEVIYDIKRNKYINFDIQDDIVNLIPNYVNFWQYDDKCLDFEKKHDVSYEDLMIQQVRDMGYRVEKIKKSRGVKK